MDTPLPPDFREFLALLNSEQIEYLLVGGYAVSFHGFPRPTGDLDVWVALGRANATRLAVALRKFGFDGADTNEDLFLTPGQIVRMGVPPVRIEVLNSISGVDFAACYRRCVRAEIDGLTVAVISREDLLANKRAAGRAKDLNDVEQLLQKRKA